LTEKLPVGLPLLKEGLILYVILLILDMTLFDSTCHFFYSKAINILASLKIFNIDLISSFNQMMKLEM
jgi:hypothetical protein